MISFSDFYSTIFNDMGEEEAEYFHARFWGAINHWEEIAIKPYEIKRILKSGPCTIVFWNDGTKTIVKRSEDDAEDDYSAFTAALAKKVYGSTSAVKRIVERTEAQKEKKAQKEPEEKPVGMELGKALAQALLKALEKSAMGAQKGE